MAFAYLLSWFLNFMLLSIILALIDSRKEYSMERKPFFLFSMAVLLPTLLELFSYLSSGMPFLSLILPEWGWLFQA